eukprot:scaffold648756_cov52-Prasinocladus_malaysianus.AAC.1
MAHFPVDSSDWRRTLDGIVAATDTNLRAIRGLHSASRGVSPTSSPALPASPSPGTPPYVPSQETIFNS